MKSTFVGVATALALFLAAARSANAVIVERVVAVVGERPILLSELRRRAAPFLIRIIASTPNTAQLAAAETEMFRELLSRMIDDRLLEQAADKARLTVTTEEVDRALTNVAASAKIPVSDLLAEARRQGLSEQDYRDELRRQVLEGKLVQLRVRGRVRVTDEDARVAYTRWVRELGKQRPADVRIIAMRIAEGATDEAIAAREAEASEVVGRARQGEDFCKLVEQYSDDTETKATCGSRGPQPIASMVPQIQEALRDLKPGGVAEPVRIGKQAVLVVQMNGETRVPPFDEVRDAMTERAFAEVMDRQRKQWLQELRRGLYVDVRL